MPLLGCFPIEITGSPTFADVIAASLTTADLTGQLAADQELIINDANGDPILTLYETDKGALFPGHLAVGSSAGVLTRDVISVNESLTGDFQNGQFVIIEADPVNSGAT